MGRFFIGSEYHDDMHGDDGQLLPGHRHKSKEELDRISQSLYDAEARSEKQKERFSNIVFPPIELPPYVNILQYEY